MFVRLCHPARASALCTTLQRPITCHLRALSLLSAPNHLSPDRTPLLSRSSQPIKSTAHHPSVSRSMPWAGALGCSGHSSLATSQLNCLRKNLTSSQRFARHAIPYVACLTIASAGALHMRKQQPDRQSRGQPASSKATFAETSAFSSMQHSDENSTPSSSDSDAPDSVQTSRPPDGIDTASEQHEDSSSLRLHIGASMIPHPEKMHKGGEDAYFMTEDGKFLGVADGVGGWSQINVDSGVYSRLLMQTAKAAASILAPSPIAPQIVLEEAHKKTNVRGTSTVCILALEDNKLHAANLGDSGFLVVRKQKVVFRCPSQQHRFNFPYQLGCPGTQSDLPEHAELYTVDLSAGDIIVAATDGLFDNVYNEETAVLVSELRQAGNQPEQTASGLAQFARKRAGDPHHPSPFAHGATLAGWPNMHGGKLDDITVLVAYVLPAAAQSKL